MAPPENRTLHLYTAWPYPRVAGPSIAAPDASNGSVAVVALVQHRCFAQTPLALSCTLEPHDGLCCSLFATTHLETLNKN